MAKKVMSVLGVIVIVAAVVFAFKHNTEPAIVIDTPKAGETVTSPLTVTGKAKGSWYFEASFPVKVLDALGNEIAAGPAQAQGEWMTEEYVPFSATLTFMVPSAQYGTIVLAKDNPSGLPENDAQQKIAVWLEPSANPEAMKVKAFFTTSSAAAGTECTTVSSVDRPVPTTQAVARAALEELLKGPTGAEKTAGFTTSIPSGVKVQSLKIEKGTAYADLSKELDAGVAGSCRVTAIRSQIEATLKQFPTVTKVVISIDGRTDDILQP